MLALAQPAQSDPLADLPIYIFRTFGQYSWALRIQSCGHPLNPQATLPTNFSQVLSAHASSLNLSNCTRSGSPVAGFKKRSPNAHSPPLREQSTRQRNASLLAVLKRLWPAVGSRNYRYVSTVSHKPPLSRKLATRNVVLPPLATPCVLPGVPPILRSYPVCSRTIVLPLSPMLPTSRQVGRRPRVRQTWMPVCDPIRGELPLSASSSGCSVSIITCGACK